jgi:hypothetical protein
LSHEALASYLIFIIFFVTGKAYQHQCQPGTAFNREKFVCSWPVGENGCGGMLSVPYKANVQQQQQQQQQQTVFYSNVCFYKECDWDDITFHRNQFVF